MIINNFFKLFFLNIIVINSYAQVINDVLKEGLNGHVKTIKRIEYLIVENDTIKQNGSIFNEEIVFNQNGQIVKKSDYTNTDTYHYDKNGLKIEEQEFDSLNNLLEKTNYFYSKTAKIIDEITKNNKDKIIRQIHYEYNSNDKLIASKKHYDNLRHYDEHRFQYDILGNLVEDKSTSTKWANITQKFEYFDNGILKKLENYHYEELEYVRVYNNKGVEIQLISYDTKNRRVEQIDESDSFGNITKKTTYKPNGIDKDEEVKYINKYNSNGNIISCKILDSNNKEINNNIYKYDKKGKLIYSNEANNFHGSNSISTNEYNKWGQLIYNHFSDYAERGSYRKYNYDLYQNEIMFYEDNGKAEGESGHEHYTFYKKSIQYFPYLPTHKIIKDKSKLLDLEMKNTDKYLVMGDSIHIYYQGKEFSTFEYKTTSGVFISGFVKNSDVKKIEP